MWVGFLGPTLFLITLTFNVGGALEFGLLPWLVTHVHSFPALAWIILPPCTKYLVAAGGDVTALSPAALPSALRYLAILSTGMALTHVLNALLAFQRARKCGLPSLPWALQSFLLGFPSTALVFSKTGAANYGDVAVASVATFIGLTCLLFLVL